jgi:hypothetical protein
MHYLLRLVPVKLAHNLSFCESRLPSEIRATTAGMPNFAPSETAQSRANRRECRAFFPCAAHDLQRGDWLAEASRPWSAPLE